MRWRGFRPNPAVFTATTLIRRTSAVRDRLLDGREAPSSEEALDAFGDLVADPTVNAPRPP